MSLRRLFSADAGLSMLLHVLKALVALFVNWLVLRHFAVDDFLVWSVTCSILVVAPAADLGIGQYTVTKLISSDRREWAAHLSQSLGALVPLALLAGLFVFLTVSGLTIYKCAMAVLLAARVVTIPFAAVLNAVNQFKIRKAIELAAYGVAALGVGVVAWTKADIRMALVVLNATFLLAAVLTVAAAARYVSLAQSLKIASPVRSAHVFRATVPFMANNLSGLLTYGGFIWLSSLVLREADVAKLAVLHTFVLMNLYQLYDVFLKARQADLADRSQLAPYYRLNLLFMLALPPLFVLAGREALALIGNPVVIGIRETALFGVFMAFEMGNLFVQSITQVNRALVHRLNIYSAIRSTLLLAFILAGYLPVAGDERLVVLLICLSVGSMMAFIYLLKGVQLRGVDEDNRPEGLSRPPAIRREK
jgi:hypothetical protein